MGLSLKSLLLKHEFALVLLVLVTGALGGAWGSFWQTTSTEDARLEGMNYAAQSIRGILFRQIKEVALARLMEDQRALKLYGKYSRQIDESFNELRKHSLSREEQNHVQDLQIAYRVVQHDMNNVFADPYLLNRVTRLKILDPNYEQRLIEDFDKAYEALTGQIERQRRQVEEIKSIWMGWMPILLPVPLIVAGALVLYSRHQVQRHFVQPMECVLAGASAMRSGDLETRINIVGVEEVSVLAQSLNEMTQALKQSRDALVETEKQAALGALVPVVAHNIRNPLAAIRASAQVLDPKDSPEELLESRRSIIEVVDRLGRWVTALLAYLHPSKTELKPTRPSAAVQAVLQLLQLRFDEVRLTVTQNWPAIEPQVPMDVDLVEQSLFGLLSNAVEASPPGARLAVSGEIRPGQGYILSITDEGPGMPFKPVRSVGLEPGRTTKRLGTGLGIPFAFKVCSLHGWILEFCARESGSGTRVEITMPLSLAGVIAQ